MSVNNAYSLLNETEGSDTSYRTIHVSYNIRLTPDMAWSDTLKETFGQETDTVEEEIIEKEEPIVEEEKSTAKKNKKAKKPQKKVEEEDLDAILKEMGVEIREDEVKPKKEQAKVDNTKKRAPKRNTSKAASIIANEAAQRRSGKKKGKK